MHIPITLLVGPLTGSHLYRDDRIVYSSGEAMGMYDTHRWASPPTEMMQEVLFRELRASGKYKTVNTLRSNARGDYMLNGRLYDFKEVTGSRLLRASRGGVRATRYARPATPCGRTTTRTTNR